jgi:hypothetical protein
MGFEKDRRPVQEQAGGRHSGTVTSTAPSTALNPKGLISLVTTTTGAPVVYDLARAPVAGDEFELHATTVASSSVAPFHINVGAGIGVGSSSEDMLALSIPGDGVIMRGVSATRWAAIGTGAVFSTST